MERIGEQMCAYCQSFFEASLVDRVGAEMYIDTEGEEIEVDVYWCGCSPENDKGEA